MLRTRIIIFSSIILLLTAIGSSQDPSLSYQKFIRIEGNNWRVHFEGSSVLTLYGHGTRKASSASAAAAQFLTDFHSMLRIKQLSDIHFVKTEVTPLGNHFYYQQYFAGMAVVGGEISLHFDQQHRLIAATNGYHPLTGSVHFTDDRESAFNTAREMFGNDASISDQGLWIFPQGSRGKAVRRLLIETDLSRGGSWLVYLDATNPRIALISKRAALTFEGEGNIWLENPVTTPSRQSQVFRNMDATKSLSGKFVKVLNANSKHDASLPLKLSDYTTAKEGDRKYNYEENDLRLAEAMAYFHINRVHDQWSLFGFHGLDARAPVIVNLAVSDGGAGWDNAQYQRSARFPRTGLYTFGSGNQYENTGLDADIYYHEYAHGVLDKINSKLLDSVESIYPAAFHEAFADISAAAITGNSKFAEFGFRLKQSKQFRGRNMNNRKKFPQDVVWPEAQLSEPHYTCLIADGTWWDLQKLIGRYQAQRLLYDSARMLSTKMNFFDVKDAMLAADRTLNNGANSAAIERSFQLHGLGGTNPGQKGTFSVQRLLTAALPPGSNYVVQSTFSKGEMVTLILEYNASNLLPGYWLVPSKLEVNGPSGATPRTQFLIAEVFNGEHQGTKGVYFAEIYTDSSSPSGTYTVKFQPRLGGTDRIFTEQSVTFTLN